jgi:uncharacterized protein YbjT (DUF2867 family)
MYAVAGVTGHTGSVVARELLERRHDVRVIVRKPEQGEIWMARGANVAVASLDDAAALAQALRGIEAAFLLLPPKYTEPNVLAAQAAIADAIAKGVAASGVGRIVFLSSHGAEREGGTGPVLALHYAEAQLVKTGAPITFVRAPYFLENWLPVLPVVKNQGVLPTFVPADFRFATASTIDIGHIAAQALLRAHTGIRVIEIEGPAPASPRDVADAMARHIGKPVVPVEAPLDAVVPTFTGLGVSSDAASLFRELYEAIVAGRVSPLGRPAEAARVATRLEDAVGRLLAPSGD